MDTPDQPGTPRLTAVNEEAAPPPRAGRCEWCRGSDEGGPIVTTARTRWWHQDCAHENYADLCEALDI